VGALPQVRLFHLSSHHLACHPNTIQTPPKHHPTACYAGVSEVWQRRVFQAQRRAVSFIRASRGSLAPQLNPGACVVCRRSWLDGAVDRALHEEAAAESEEGGVSDGGIGLGDSSMGWPEDFQAVTPVGGVSGVFAALAQEPAVAAAAASRQRVVQWQVSAHVCECVYERRQRNIHHLMCVSPVRASFANPNIRWRWLL